MISDQKRATLIELREKARNLVAECGTNTDNPLLQLIDDLCKEGDTIIDEEQKEKEDLKQQVYISFLNLYLLLIIGLLHLQKSKMNKFQINFSNRLINLLKCLDRTVDR